MKQKLGPYSTPGAMRQWAANEVSPMMALRSGEITGNITDAPLGASNVGGKIQDFWLSCEESGKDDSSNTLSLTADLKINGTTCMTTAPIIAHVSGEASTNKTTKVSGDTGVTQAVVNPAANDLSPGDMLTYDVTLTRTASPTTEMRNLAVVVAFEPT